MNKKNNNNNENVHRSFTNKEMRATAGRRGVTAAAAGYNTWRAGPGRDGAETAKRGPDAEAWARRDRGKSDGPKCGVDIA